MMLGCSSPDGSVKIQAPEVTPKVALKEMKELTNKAMTSINLKDFQWQNRLLLLFASGEDSAEYREQLELFEAAQADFVERDLLLFELLADGNSRWDEQAIAPSDVSTIRSQFNIGPEDFAVILIGKDGTQKRKDNQPVDPQLIFLDIDAMPMRQREMQ